MEEAIYKLTGELVEAEDLPIMDIIDIHAFKCPDQNCSVKLTASSFGKDHKKRPYFRKSDNSSEHASDCQYYKKSKYIDAGKMGSIKVDDEFPLSYPNKLTIDEKIEVIMVEPNASTANEPKGISTVNRTGQPYNKKPINRVVTTLKQIVRQYIDFPYDRDLPLNLPFIGPTAYKYAFKKISYHFSHNKYKSYRIYYGEFIVHQDMTPKDDILNIALFECREWKDKKQLDPYIVEISLKSWGPLQRAKFINKIEYIRQEQIEKHAENENRCFLFFLANAPSKNNEYMFMVDNPKLIEPFYGIVEQP